jgi:hypothetical protein
MARQTRRKIKRRQASRRLSRRSSRRQKQRGGGGDPPAPELPEITITVDPYTPYLAKPCKAMTAEGKWVTIVDIDPELLSLDKADNPEWVAAADKIFKKVVYETTLAGQSDGVYTYFVYKNKHAYPYDEEHADANVIRLGCIQVRSGLEFGTTHTNLADYLGLYISMGEKEKMATLLFAGEFKKAGTSITYNFQSGTFVAGHNTDIGRHNIEKLKLIITQRCAIMESLLETYGLKGTFNPTPLIKAGEPYFTDAEKTDLESLQLEIKIFDSEKKCQNYIMGEDEDEDDDD